MNEKEKYINAVDADLKKYKGKISKMETIAKKYNASNKNKVLSEGKAIIKKYKDAEDIYEKLKSSTQENYEEIKEAASEIFDSLSTSFDNFTHLVTLKDIARIQEGLAEYTYDSLSETEDYIKQHPLIVVAAALGVGVLVGLLINRIK